MLWFPLWSPSLFSWKKVSSFASFLHYKSSRKAFPFQCVCHLAHTLKKGSHVGLPPHPHQNLPAVEGRERIAQHIDGSPASWELCEISTLRTKPFGWARENVNLSKWHIDCDRRLEIAPQGLSFADGGRRRRLPCCCGPGINTQWRNSKGAFFLLKLIEFFYLRGFFSPWFAALLARSENWIAFVFVVGRKWRPPGAGSVDCVWKYENEIGR